MLRLSISLIYHWCIVPSMQRINVMISDESKAILLKFQEKYRYGKLDDALDMFIKEAATA
jgi:hypothetical protein